MERILTSEEMKRADEYTIKDLKIPESALIERAGEAVFEEIIKRFKGGRVLVCLGKGNNGKDGKVIAEKLSKIHGFTVSTVNISNGIFKIFDYKFDIIVDCIFGIGLNRCVEGKYLKAIELINSSKAFVVACDIPSGINSDTGLVMGASVRANLTVAIQEYKLGHFLNDGPDFCGKIVLKDIGISVWGEDYVKRAEKKDVLKLFPERKRKVNKGDFGKCAIIGGSVDYTGSVILSLNALIAMKAGTGYSCLFIPKSLFTVYAGMNPECLICTVGDKDGRIIFDKDAMDKAMQCSAIAFGMGAGKSFEVYECIKYLLKNYTGKLLLDADAINSLAEYGVDILDNKTCDVLLTPHLGEFSRLINIKKELIMSDIITLSKDFAMKHNVVLIVKSATSIITDGEDVYINTTGNSALSKAGSGDVLSGFIAGIMARENGIKESAIGGAFILGLSGEIASDEQNQYTVTASDVIKALPKAINSL